jgi:hypothetical protein
MATASSPTPPPRATSVFRGFDESIERAVGFDARLLYGMTAPILMVLGLIILLALSPQTWLVVSVVVIELAALGLVGVGLAGMLSEDDEDDRSLD